MEHTMAQRETIRDKWIEICEQFSVPKQLFDHQADTIALLLSKNNVFCGLPIGSGKTLAQLTTVLFTEGTALEIPPLLTIEKQMCEVLNAWNISYLNLSVYSNPQDIATELESKSPRIIISSIEKISDRMFQKALINIKLEYVAIDEAQVLDPLTGWVKIRPYNQETWSFLRARFKCPFLLMSATMEEKSLQRIAENLDLERTSIKVLFKSPDRKNIYEQRRFISKPVDVSNVSSELQFLVPTFVDGNFVKCQVFCTTRNMTDIVAAYFKSELTRISNMVGTVPQIEKLTGDNSKLEKERVMQSFKEGVKVVLICTDVAGMGIDIQDLNFCVNLGIPKNSWKLKQQSGRIGRSGESSINITIVFPQKGVSAPEPVLRKVMRGAECIRKEINELFILSAPLVNYTEDSELATCGLSCERCVCHLCVCCSVCTYQCRCSSKVADLDEVMENILGFGDEKYRNIKEFYKSLVFSDESELSESDNSDHAPQSSNAEDDDC